MATFNGTEGEEFSLSTAADWTANYRNANPDSIKAYFFGKDILNSILNQTGCVGIRFYYALDDSGVPHLILVGADANGNDQYNKIVAQRGLPCPDQCDGNSSPLNG